jgi:flagellar biogenesis protein FliO
MVGSAQAVSQSPLSTQSSYSEMLLVSLLLVAVVCVVGYVVARSFGRGSARGVFGLGRRGDGLLEVVARQPLEPRRCLYVVRVAGRTLLLGTSEMGLAMLTELDLPRSAEAPSDGSRTPSFAELVRDAGTRLVARHRHAKASPAAELGALEDAAAGGPDAETPVGSGPVVEPRSEAR